MMRGLAERWLDPVFVSEAELASRSSGIPRLIRRYILSPGFVTNASPATDPIIFGPPITGQSWIIEAIYYEWLTSAAAGVRFPSIVLTDRNDPALRVENIVPIFSNPSEEGRLYMFPYSGPYLYNLAGIAQGGVFPLPLLEIMDEGITIELNGADANDTHRALIYYREVVK